MLSRSCLEPSRRLESSESRTNRVPCVCSNFVNVTGGGIIITAFNVTRQPGFYQNHRNVRITGNTIQVLSLFGTQGKGEYMMLTWGTLVWTDPAMLHIGSNMHADKHPKIGRRRRHDRLGHKFVPSCSCMQPWN